MTLYLTYAVIGTLVVALVSNAVSAIDRVATTLATQTAVFAAQPTFGGLTEAELLALEAYVRSLGPTALSHVGTNR